MEPHQKRFRSENGGYWSNQPRADQFSGNSNQECKRFNSPDGCPFGSTCRFRHVPADGRDSVSDGLSSGGKPKPCMKFFSTTGCPFGESCHFTHYVPGGLSSLGLAPVVSFSAAPFASSQRKMVAPMGDPSATVNGYKTKLCNRFSSAEGCRFGEKCHFAHGEGDLRSSSNQPQGNHQRAPVGGPRMGPPPGYNNEGSRFSNTGNFGNTMNLPSQGNDQAIPPGVAVGGYSANYVSGSTDENVQVY